MNLDTLAPEGQRTLCRKAEELCLARIRAILRQTDPNDPALRRLLEDIEQRDGLHLDEILRMEPDAGDLDDEADPSIHFPSARVRLGEAPLDRETAMYHLESLMEDAWRFFKDRARGSDREEARAVYSRIALDQLGLVAHLRTVLL